jgi:hypothetical protein
VPYRRAPQKDPLIERVDIARERLLVTAASLQIRLDRYAAVVKHTEDTLAAFDRIRRYPLKSSLNDQR